MIELISPVSSMGEKQVSTFAAHVRYRVSESIREEDPCGADQLRGSYMDDIITLESYLEAKHQGSSDEEPRADPRPPGSRADPHPPGSRADPHPHERADPHPHGLADPHPQDSEQFSWKLNNWINSLYLVESFKNCYSTHDGVNCYFSKTHFSFRRFFLCLRAVA